MIKQPSSTAHRRRLARSAAGFTLVELIVTVAILAILAVVALPAYRQYVAKSRRADAISALATVQQAQERWRANKPGYADSLADMGLPANADAKHYDIAIKNASATGYTLVATPRAGGLQTADSDCSSMSITMKGGTSKYGALNGANSDSADTCWPK
ncbi:type IV pilin protein [Paucibacter soli]|uniref:type IV pilin protein n=1 Tax=Paucibacter soli TaxID=3133433 RepID=UPI00309E4CFB